MLSTLLLISLAAAPPAQSTGAPAGRKATPAPRAIMVARVDTAKPVVTEVEEWAKQLRAAIEARKDEFRMAKRGEEPELRVLVKSVSPAKDGKTALRLALARGEQTHEFSYFYEGKVASHAAILARNLRAIVDNMGSAAPAPRKKK